jgi:integrase
MARKGDGIYRRGHVWRLDAIINGRRRIVTLGKNIKRGDALELASIKRAAILKGDAGIGEKGKDIRFKDARRLYWKWVETNRAVTTRRQYEQCLDRLETEFGARKLSQISSFSVEAYKHRRMKDAPVCANREIATLRQLYNWLTKHKKFKGDNPAASFERVKESRGRLRILSPEEEKALLENASEPVKSLIILGLNCGLRVKREGLTLTWKSIDFANQMLTVEAAFSKNHEMREIPLNSIALETLTKLKKKSPGPWVFMTRGKGNRKAWRKLKNYRTAFETACRNAKLSGVMPHTLRHTWASRLDMNGASPKTLMELGGWKDLKMVARYSHTSLEHRRAAVETLVNNSTPTTTPGLSAVPNSVSPNLLTSKQDAPVAQVDRAAVS